MTILLVLSLLFLSSVLYFHHHDESAVAFFGAAVFGVVLFVALLCLPLSRMGIHAQLAEMQAVRDTPRGQDYDSAAWRTKMAEYNAWLAGQQYYRHHTPFTLWIPAAVDRAEPLR